MQDWERSSARHAPAEAERSKATPVVRRGSRSGSPLPEPLRRGLEHLSGISLGDVRVERGVFMPGALGAAAYTSGSRIHLGPGGDRHLAHEAWHVVQQRQGRVRPTTAVAGVALNDTLGLEREADRMGDRATRIRRSTVPRVDRSAASPVEAVIQRYSLPAGPLPNDLHNEQRLSTSGRMFRKSAHELYVDPALVAPANATLSATGGGAGSFVSLQLLDEFERGLQRVVPIVRQRPTQLLRSQGPRKTFLEQDPAGTYQSPADCHVAAQTVMGSDDSAIGSFNSEKPRMAMPDHPSENFDAADEAGAHIANRAKHQFFARAMPAFADYLRKHSLAALPQYQETIAAIDAVDAGTVEFGINNAWAAVYRDVILRIPAIGKLFAATFKVNEFAEPAVGRAFTNVNDESQKYAREQRGDDVWNFHWAGTVLVDGKDYVTLENLSTENINELNTSWFFHLYGASSQSFHAESLRDPHATPGAITLGVDTNAQAAHPRRNLAPTANQKIVLHWLNDRAHDNATLDQLDTCRVKFGQPRDALYGICDKLFGYNKADVDNPANFASIQRDIREAIVDRHLPTAAPVAPARGIATTGVAAVTQ